MVTVVERGSGINTTATTTTTQLVQMWGILSISEKITLGVTTSFINILIFIFNLLVYVAARSLSGISAGRRRASGSESPVPMSRPQSITYFLIKQLVYSDVMVGVVTISEQVLLMALQMPLSRSLCASLRSLRVLTAMASLYLLTVISFERWWVITFPFRALSFQSVRWLVRVCWICVFLLISPLAFVTRTSTVRLNSTHFVRTCVSVPSDPLSATFVRGYLGTSFVFPLVVSAILTVLIMRRIKASKIAVSFSKSARAAARSSTHVTTVLLFSGLPLLAHILASDILREPSARTTLLFLTISYLLRNVNAAINPILTIYNFAKIRDKVKGYLRLTKRASFSPQITGGRITTHFPVKLVAVIRAAPLQSIRRAKASLK